MAIFHLSAKAVQRSKGRSAVAASAYRAGVCLTDERTGEVHDYARRSGVVFSEVVTLDGQSIDREILWNAAESAERRKDGTTAREYEVALPDELDEAQRVALARQFARVIATRQGCAVDLCVHVPGKGDQRNHHAHLLCTTRRVEFGKMGPKCAVELSDSKRKELGLPGRRADLEDLRYTWEKLVNAELSKAGHREQVDHRSLADQGVDREPTIHLGPAAAARERAGRETERGEINRERRRPAPAPVPTPEASARKTDEEQEGEAERERSRREAQARKEQAQQEQEAFTERVRQWRERQAVQEEAQEQQPRPRLKGPRM